MKVITAVNKYLRTDREIFIESVSDGSLVHITKRKDISLEFGERIANCKVKKIDEEESEKFVTIYI